MRILIATFLIALCAAAQTPRPAARTVSPKDLKYPPLRPIRTPDITTFTLDNGMKVHLLQNHEIPLVRGSARVRTGNVHEPSGKAGLTDIFEQALRTGGTKSRTGDQINEALENVAASVEANMSDTAGTVSFNTLKENTDLVLDIFKDILSSPEFRQDKIEVAKTRARGGIARRNDQPAGIASREFNRLLYGRNTPWGREMEYETVEKVTREDLLEFHKRYFFPANIVLAVNGDFETAAMRAQLEKLFAGWNAKQGPVPPFPAVTNVPKPGLYFAEKKDVNQTNFRIGHLGGLLNDTNYPAIEVMNDILGGSAFSSRLVQTVRSDLGLAYNVGSAWNAGFTNIGTFTIYGGTKSESTLQAIQAIRKEIDRIRTTEISDEELKIAKESILNGFVFNFDSPAKFLSRLVLYEYYGYPKNFIDTYQKAIGAVTKADVLRVAKDYLKPENFVMVLVGNPAEMGTQLASLNMPVNKLDITIPEPKREGVKSDAASLARGKAMLQAFQKAIGGADKLAAIKDYSHVAALSLPPATQTTKAIPPQIRFEQSGGFGSIVVYYDGKGGGFLKAPQGEMPLQAQPVAMRQAKDEVFRMHPTLWLSDRDPDRTVNATGPRSVEIGDKDGNRITLHFDEKTGLLEQSTYSSPGMNAPVELEAAYSDWKEVSGIKMPHKAKISSGGKQMTEITVKEYKLNSGLTPEELSKK
ncbi:MAG: insulinase family protein [Candidatus Solibacter usitatus]|nr:insulinase family protein [Candidatus Solibacter usitatus]